MPFFNSSSGLSDSQKKAAEARIIFLQSMIRGHKNQIRICREEIYELRSELYE